MKVRKMIEAAISSAALAAMGVALGALSYAEEPTTEDYESGVQSHCQNSLESGGVDTDALASVEQLTPEEAYAQRTDASEAFCTGLQVHGTGESYTSGYQVVFNNWSKYKGSSEKKIMAPSVSYDMWGYGDEHCVTGSVREKCAEIKGANYMLNVPAHPDYSSEEFGGEAIKPPYKGEVTFLPGSYAGAVVNAGDTKVYFQNDPDNPIERPTWNIKYLGMWGTNGEVHLSPGDYFIETLRLQGDNVKVIVEGEGTARIFVTTAPTIGPRAYMNWGQDPSKLILVSEKDIGAGNLFVSGYIYAKHWIWSNDTGGFNGALSAQRVTLSGSTTVTEDISTIANVDWGDLTASPGVYTGAIPPTPGDQNRHSGTYQLDYTNANGDWALDEVYAVADLHAFGHIQIGTLAFPYGFQLEVPIANLTPDNADALDGWKQEDIENWNGVYDATWDGVYDEDAFPVSYGAIDDADIGCSETIPECGNVLVRPHSWATSVEREAAKNALKTKIASAIDTAYQNVKITWAEKFAVLPDTITYKTFYFDGGASNKGLAGFRFNGATHGWVALMNDNKRTSVPVKWVYATLPLGAITPYGPAGVICEAYVAAGEVGCFQPEPGEANPRECKIKSASSGEFVDVALAMNMYAASELGCVAAGPGMSMSVSLGAGVKFTPIGTKL